MGFSTVLLAILLLTVPAGAGASADTSAGESTSASASASASAVSPEAPSQKHPPLRWRIVNVYPHDANAFTQGLLYDGGLLYESTGLNGRSSLRKVEPATGKVLKSRRLPSEYFGEGLVLWHNFLIQLTWKTERAFVYDKETFVKQRELTYAGEGWGITTNGASLIMSNGSSVLTFLSPDTFAEERRITVRDHVGPVTGLNELEYVKGEIFANIWGEDRVARVSPRTGEVLGWIDFSPLRRELSPMQRVDVLNGMAYNPANGRLYVTGKLWPKLFEIELYPAVADEPGS